MLIKCLFLKKYILLSLYREEGRERARNINERESSICCLLHTPYWGYACNQGTCPWPESNPGPPNPQADALSIEPNRSRQNKKLLHRKRNLQQNNKKAYDVLSLNNSVYRASASLQTRGSQVRFRSRACALVAGTSPVRGVQEAADR